MEKVIKRPYFCLFLAFLLVNLPVFGHFEALSVRAASVYEVEDVSVNVSDDSPAKARALAFATARRDAFLILLARLGVNVDFAQKVDDEEMVDLVRSERVFDEKMLGNVYIATFNITFAKDFIDNLFERKRSSVPQEQKIERKLSFLMIPAEVLQKKTLLWESQNRFKKAVKRAVARRKIENFNVAEADIDNLATLNEDNIKTIAAPGVASLFAKYHSDIIYITLFDYDEGLKKASVLVRGFERARNFQYRLSFINSGDLPYERLIERVSDKMVEYLSELTLDDIREQKLASELIRFYVPITKLGDWLDVKNKIEASGLVSQMNVEVISRDYVKLSVSYNNAQEIAMSFANIGLTLVPKADNAYVVLRD